MILEEKSRVTPALGRELEMCSVCTLQLYNIHVVVQTFPQARKYILWVCSISRDLLRFVELPPFA